MDKQVILFGAGIVGRSVLFYYKPEQVLCFVDNDKSKQGEEFCGKKVISFEELVKIHRDYKVLITISYPNSELILKQCKEENIPVTMYWDEFTPERFESKPVIAKLKDIHKGKRCFIIGNGPSLTPDDLEVLHNNNEICFASNYITRIYPYTKWRPNYYMLMDSAILTEDFGVIQRAEADMIILPELSQRYYGDINEANRIMKRVEKGGTPIVLLVIIAGNTRECYFSPNPSKLVYSIRTVTVAHLQMAAYMGFSEIYLLGCDNTPGNIHDIDKYISENSHFYTENETDRIIALKLQRYNADSETRKIQVEKQYRYSDEHLRAYGTRLYNATRGGELEALERVNFESLFKMQEDGETGAYFVS